MNWSRETPMNLISECKRFRICKAFVRGEPIYTLSDGPLMKAVLVTCGTLDECKQAAENLRGAKAA